MSQLFTNNASSTLTGAISDSDLSIPIQVADAGEFPVVAGSDFYLVTLESEDGSKIEILKCDGKTASTIEVETGGRGYEGTTPQAFSADDRVELRMTAGSLDIFLQKSGGTMTGDIDVDDNDIIDATLLNNSTNNEIVGYPIRGDAGDSSNEFVVPPAGSDPTIEYSGFPQKVWHNGNVPSADTRVANAMQSNAIETVTAAHTYGGGGSIAISGGGFTTSENLVVSTNSKGVVDIAGNNIAGLDGSGDPVVGDQNKALTFEGATEAGLKYATPLNANRTIWDDDNLPNPADSVDVTALEGTLADVAVMHVGKFAPGGTSWSVEPNTGTWTITRNGGGDYTITHSRGKTMIITATLEDSATGRQTVIIDNNGASSFDLQIRNSGGLTDNPAFVHFIAIEQ